MVAASRTAPSSCATATGSSELLLFLCPLPARLSCLHKLKLTLCPSCRIAGQLFRYIHTAPSPPAPPPTADSSAAAVEPHKVGDYLVYPRTLGSGGFSSVHLALDTRSLVQVACKRLPRARVGKDRLEIIRREVDMLKRATHPNINRIEAVEVDDVAVCVPFSLTSSFHSAAHSCSRSQAHLPRAVRSLLSPLHRALADVSVQQRTRRRPLHLPHQAYPARRARGQMDPVPAPPRPRVPARRPRHRAPRRQARERRPRLYVFRDRRQVPQGAARRLWAGQGGGLEVQVAPRCVPLDALFLLHDRLSLMRLVPLTGTLQYMAPEQLVAWTRHEGEQLPFLSLSRSCSLA